LAENDLTNQKNLEEAAEQAQSQVEAPANNPVNEPAAAGEIAEQKTETATQTVTSGVASFSAENEIKGAHDDFDWDIDKKDKAFAEDDDALIKAYEDTFKEIQEHVIIPGTVASITTSDVVLNIGHKSDGLVSRSEFRDMEDLKIGDEVEVYVVSQEDERGQLVLSRKNAKLMKAWNNIIKAHKEDIIVKGRIISKTKGGLIADVYGLETFLPGSQIDVKPIIDYDTYVGQTMEFKVVKVNENIKNAVVSHKALIESDLAEQRQKIIGQLEKGQVLEGTIKNITDFGAFIDLGGVDGLLYITDISWGRINHPSEVLELNQKLNVVVLEYDENKKRISLGLKQLQPHPWDILSENVQEGSTVKGKIVNIEDYGAFIEIEPGVEGLVHVSEVSWSNQPINSRDFFKLNDEYEAKVVTINREERKMSLSVKQLSADPWQDIKTKFPLESRHSGAVKNITPYGVFVELGEGIGGMVHISDLSWTKRFNHPNEYTKVGTDLEVVVLEIDEEARKLSLGHKQIEEDPWDTFEGIFPVGSEHEGTVIKKDDKGGVVSLPYGVEAFAPNRHLKKEDGTLAGADDVMPFKVIEFNRDDKRIVISHTRIWEDVKRGEMGEERKQKEKKQKKARSAVRNMNKNIEKSTFGDLDILAQLKQQMQDGESGVASTAAAAAAAAAATPQPAKAEEKQEEAKAEKEADKTGEEE